MQALLLDKFCGIRAREKKKKNQYPPPSVRIDKEKQKLQESRVGNAMSAVTIPLW